jgi:hypothetical protein
MLCIKVRLSDSSDDTSTKYHYLLTKPLEYLAGGHFSTRRDWCALDLSASPLATVYGHRLVVHYSPSAMVRKCSRRYRLPRRQIDWTRLKRRTKNAQRH